MLAQTYSFVHIRKSIIIGRYSKTGGLNLWVTDTRPVFTRLFVSDVTDFNKVVIL
jgi:hypothetical protein